jgi:hypothetical protein
VKAVRSGGVVVAVAVVDLEEPPGAGELLTVSAAVVEP